MADREIVVSVTEQDWEALAEAADTAGMSVQDYICWCVRIVTARSRSGTQSRRADYGDSFVTRPPSGDELESESQAWTETFAERLSHRTERTPHRR
ncbi:hypothetical protein ACWIGI_37645 [Nocardia sp. NPDC055321]